MIVKFLQIFTEYISIILCIHKYAKEKVKVSWNSLFEAILYVMLVFVIGDISYGKMVIYTYLFLYSKIKIVKTWKQLIISFCMMICTIPMLQIIIYTVIGREAMKVFDVSTVGVIISTLIIIILFVWKEKYLMIIMDMVTKYRKIIFLVLLILLFKYLISYYTEYKVIKSYFMDQIAICFLIIALMLILWINAENEKKHKAEELRTYQLYTKTFEDAVAAIRMRQHEFDNHINAIKCMRYTIQDTEKLFDEQDKYCDEILQDNKFNKLLKSNMSPILTGYLYSKFMAASAQNIDIKYEIQDINIDHIEINDLIEIIGILFDNAVEALEEQGDKEMEVSLFNRNNVFTILVANISAWKTNGEIEKFFEYGYSTKGREHGIGLYRVNVLLKKYKGNIQVENITKNSMNYICFKVSL